MLDGEFAAPSTVFLFFCLRIKSYYSLASLRTSRHQSAYTYVCMCYVSEDVCVMYERQCGVCVRCYLWPQRFAFLLSPSRLKVLLEAPGLRYLKLSGFIPSIFDA